MKKLSILLASAVLAAFTMTGAQAQVAEDQGGAHTYSAMTASRTWRFR